MAKFKLTADQIQVLLLVILPIAKDLAAKTATKIDDRLVAALEAASTNPILLALVMSLLSGTETPAVVPAEVKESADVLTANADQVAGLFSLVA
jgi:hypothetical protein